MYNHSLICVIVTVVKYIIYVMSVPMTLLNLVDAVTFPLHLIMPIIYDDLYIVVRYPMANHAPPSRFETITAFCQDVENWLAQHPQNVVAIHCKVTTPFNDICSTDNG
jgi:hypothetical protein